MTVSGGVGTYEVVVAHGRKQLVARVNVVGDDLVIVIGGGSQPHVGCTVVSVPSRARANGGFSPSTSVLSIPPHKEEPIARTVAEAVCSVSGRVVVVTAGVHEDGLDRRGIRSYLDLGRELANALVLRVNDSG